MAVVDRWLPPLKDDHPLVHDFDEQCPVCKERFNEGEVIGLLPVQLCAPGKKYDSVVAIPVHKKCYLNEGDDDEP